MDAKCQIGSIFFLEEGKMERIIQKATIWVFPKIGVPPKWMVYDGKPY